MVIPVGDLNPTRRRPHVNWLFLLVNLGVFAWQHLVLTPCEALGLLYSFALVPQELLGLAPLDPSVVEQTLGACALTGPDKWVPLTLLTSMFLHADLWHLLGNLLFLFVFGDNVEDRLGPARYVVFYLAGGVAAGLAYTLLQPGSTIPLVGASGGVAAVLGAYLVLHPRARVLTFVPFPLYLVALILPGVRIRLWLLVFAIVKLPAWLLLGGWLVFQFVGIGDPDGANVAYEAHIAGFVAGILLLLALDRRRLRRGQTPLHEPWRPTRRRR